MKEAQFKPIAKKFLNQFGFEVQDIQSEEGVETPDFSVIGKNCKYTMELKTKGDDFTEIEQNEKRLNRGELVTKSIPIGPRNRLAAIIRKGVKQMVEYDPHGETFRVIWLHSAGEDPQLHYARFRSTLYGTEKLFSLRIQNLITCYYFHESAFFSWRDYLDGAILTFPGGAQLCINTLSNRVEEFRETELVIRMSNGLCDPTSLDEKYDAVMIADCDIDRKNSSEILLYLQKKYRLNHLQPIPMQQHTGMMAFPIDEDS